MPPRFPRFASAPPLAEPRSALLLSILLLAVLAFEPATHAQNVGSLTTLHSFAGGDNDGAIPAGSLIQTQDGILYGTTTQGGPAADGTVFSITTDGTFTPLYRFSGGDGNRPNGGVIQGIDGNLYGTTFAGGDYGHGTVFALVADGTLTTLHSFNSFDDYSYPSGTAPYAGLIRDTDGTFYSTTETGGASGGGTFFSITSTGYFSTLHSFKADDGVTLFSSPTLGRDGNFYGTANAGGSGSAGTVYSLTPAGVFTVLHNFSGTNNDGAAPWSKLVEGQDGTFYGTTANGGVSGKGTVFSITSDGTLTTLHSFTGTNGDGATPFYGLTQGSDGNFYGMTCYGGVNGDGTIFSMTPGGVLTNLHSFNGTDGASPLCSLIQGSDGNFYGTTVYGGTSGKGTIFQFNPTASPGALQFAAAAVNVAENAGSVSLVVSRTGGSAGAVSVTYTTSDGTALADTDYTPTSGALSWADGDSADKTFTVPILDRSIYDGSTRTFSVVLSAPTGNATPGTPTAATVSILDNDTAPQPGLTIVSPPDGTTFTAGADLPLAVSATDPGGILRQVQFLINGTPVGAALTAAPYVLDATAPTTPGSYTIEALATDALSRTTSASVTVHVAGTLGAAPPTVAVLTPLEGRNLAAGSTLTLSVASAAAATTALDRLSVYADGVLVTTFDANGNPLVGTGGRPVRRDAAAGGGSIFQTPFQLPAVDKIINLIAVALDKLGQTTVSKIASVHATLTSDRAPLVAIAGLTNGAHLHVGVPSTINVVASDPDESATGQAGRPVRRDATTDAVLARLEYFLNGNPVGIATAPPYGFDFTPATPGKYVVSAVATDGSGLATVSDPVTVEVLPTVNLAVSGTGVAIEGGAKGVVLVTRTGDDTSASLTVSYKAKGSAVGGVDYKTLPGTVTIPAGASTAKIKVKPINGSPNAGTLKVKLVLLPSPDDSYTVGTTPAKIKLIGD